jgi:hydroxymethylpyrimidine/phosphomethylpyrimidine kinase
LKNILTIAGFDPSSGAGITRDLDVFFSLGAHGLSVPTCIVNQGPGGVADIYPIGLDYFSRMLETVKDGARVDGVKIGVMRDESHVEALSEFISSFRADAGFNMRDNEMPVVLDPIISAKNNTRLLSDKGLNKLVGLIFPLTTVVTPNIDEARNITGKKIENLDDMKKCAEVILKMGVKSVVIKGGHLKGEPVDLLYDGREFVTWRKQRLAREIHGTGCTFSSSLLAFLVRGGSLKDAFEAAEQYMQDFLNNSYRIADNGYFYMSSAALQGLVKR